MRATWSARGTTAGWAAQASIATCAALRSHVHALRGKLSAAGFTGSVEPKTGVGYRLMLEPRD